MTAGDPRRFSVPCKRCGAVVLVVGWLAVVVALALYGLTVGR